MHLDIYHALHGTNQIINKFSDDRNYIQINKTVEITASRSHLLEVKIPAKSAHDILYCNIAILQ